MYISPFLSVFNSVLHGLGEMSQSFYGSDFYLLQFQFSCLYFSPEGFTFYSYFYNYFIFQIIYVLNCMHRRNRDAKFKNRENNEHSGYIILQIIYLKHFFIVGHLGDLNNLVCTVNVQVVMPRFPTTYFDTLPLFFLF